MRIVFGVVLLASSFFSVAQAAPLLKVKIVRETKDIGQDGVTRSTQYTETMLRDAQNIWIERVLPEENKHEKHGAGHQHLNFSEAAQHYSKTAQGLSKINLVLKHDQTVVHLQEVDIDMLGLNNCWSCVYSVFNPKILSKMKVIRKDQSTIWYEIKNKKNHINVVWDQQNKIAKKVQIRSLDGRHLSTTESFTQKVNVIEPWKQYANFKSKDYADFGD